MTCMKESIRSLIFEEQIVRYSYIHTRNVAHRNVHKILNIW